MAIITLNNNSLSGVTALPAGVGGKVIQMVHDTTTTITSTSSTSYIDVLKGGSTWETSITPTTAGNKILVMPTIKCAAGFGSNAECRATFITLLKVGAGSYSTFIDEPAQNLGHYDYGGGGAGVGGYNYYSMAKAYTTSSTDIVTVKFQVKVSGLAVQVNSNNSDGMITLFEIGA
jgi:hypothetical protein